MSNGFSSLSKTPWNRALTKLSLFTLLSAATFTGSTPVFNSISTVAAETSVAAELQVQINDLAPRVLTKEEKLIVKGTVSSKSEVKTLNLTLRMRANTPLNEKFLTDYLEGENFGGQWITTTALHNVTANQETPFTIEVPTNQLPLGDALEWGPRGIEVIADTAETFASDRSILVWDSGIELEPTRIHAVVPVPAVVKLKNYNPVSEPADTKQWQWVTKVAELPGASLAVPTNFLNLPEIQSALSTGASEVIALPEGYANLAALQQFAGSPLGLDGQLESVRNSGIKVRADVAVVNAQPTQALLQDWVGHTVVGRALALENPDDYTFQPSTLSAFNAQGQLLTQKSADASLLVSTHPQLNQLFAKNAKTAADQLDQTQLLRSISAIITRERPFEPRSFATLLPANNLSETQVLKLQALLQNRWVKTAKEFYGPADLPAEIPLRTLPAENNPQAFSYLQPEVNTLTESFNSALPLSETFNAQPDLKNDYEHSLVYLCSNYVGTGEDLQARITGGFTKRAMKLADAISVAKPATINLLDRSANLPLRVVNTADADANITVELFPSDPRLQVTKRVSVNVPAKSEQQIEFPVKAIGSGDVVVHAVISNSAGTVIDQRTRFTVRVRADWESTGTLIFSIFLAVLFVAGTIRTIRNGRRMRPTYLNEVTQAETVEDLNEGNHE